MMTRARGFQRLAPMAANRSLIGARTQGQPMPAPRPTGGMFGGGGGNSIGNPNPLAGKSITGSPAAGPRLGGMFGGGGGNSIGNPNPLAGKSITGSPAAGPRLLGGVIPRR